MTVVGWEWMWRRTHRLAMLLLAPRVLDGAVTLVDAMDAYAAAKGVPPSRLTVGEPIFVKGLDYIELPLLID